MSEEKQKQLQFKVQYRHKLGWSKLYVWTTSSEKAMAQAKAILGENAGEEWTVEEV